MTRDAEQEVKPCGFVGGACTHCEATERGDCQGWVSSPKREWVGLTNKEIAEILCDDRWQMRPELMLLACQAKLKEKNT